MAKDRRKTDTGDKGQKLRLYVKSNSHRFLLLAAALLALAIMRVAVPLSQNAINSERNTVFAEAWQYSVNGEAFCEVVLPHSQSTPAGSQITLKNQLPSEMVKGATTLLRTSQQDVAVYVAGTNIYSSYDLEKGIPAPSSAYHFVRLPTDYAGKEITVVLSSPFENYAGFMNQIYIGSKASNVFFLVGENGLRFVIGFLIASIGFLLMVMFLFARGRGNKAAVIYLGAFFVCAGYWVVVESKMAQFILPYPVSLTNSSIFALTLLPVFSGLYYFNTHLHVFRKAGEHVITIVTSASFLLGFAACANPMLPLRILPYYLVFMGLYLLAIFVLILMEGVRSDRFFSASICGVIVFGVCGLVELVFYLRNMNNYNQSNFLTIGLLLFCVAMVADVIQNVTKVYGAAIKVDALSILAYTDILTGLKNRAAFLEKMSETQVAEGSAVTIAMYDINNLKVVNDTLGHLVGDAMLRHSAKAIKSSLRQQDEVYRIGGDEFVSIIRHEPGLATSSFEARMFAVLQKENLKRLNYQLSIAYGYATFSKDTDKTLFDTLARSDEKMYTRKKIQKNSAR